MLDLAYYCILIRMKFSKQPQQDTAFLRLGPPISLDFSILRPTDKAYIVLHITFDTLKSQHSYISALKKSTLMDFTIYKESNKPDNIQRQLE